jgi:hypothetical protein
MTKEEKQLQPWNDPIISEVRQAHEALFAEFDYNLTRFAEELRRKQIDTGRHVIYYRRLNNKTGEKEMKIGWAIPFAILGFCVVARAEDDVTLRLSRRDLSSRYIVLSFENASKAEVELGFVSEGSGECNKYFEIEATKKDGENAPASFLYAPYLGSYVVRLKPKSLYVHWIQPGAYLNGTGLEKLAKIRVKYTNPLTGKIIVSDWLILDKK